MKKEGFDPIERGKKEYSSRGNKKNQCRCNSGPFHLVPLCDVTSGAGKVGNGVGWPD